MGVLTCSAHIGEFLLEVSTQVIGKCVVTAWVGQQQQLLKYYIFTSFIYVPEQDSKQTIFRQMKQFTNGLLY